MDLINPLVRRWLDAATADPDGFWAAAAEQLPWFRKWDRVLEWDSRPFAGSAAARPTWPTTASTTMSPQAGAGTPRSIYLNERGERRRLHLCPDAARGGAAGGGAARPGHRQGRPDDHLHADLPRGDHR